MTNLNSNVSNIIINHATVRQKQALPDFLNACADRGMTQVSLWGDEIDRTGMDITRRILADTGLSVFGYNRAGPFLADDPSERRKLINGCIERIEQAAALDADHIFAFTGGLSSGSRDWAGAQIQAEDTLAQLLEVARAAGIKLALEPLHPMLAGARSCMVTLSHANALCDRLGDGIGIVVDVYHTWWDDRLKMELVYAGERNRIISFHVNDWLVPTRDLLTDRGMMGDGIIDLQAFWLMMQDAGYKGPIEVEIFSEDWWARDPDNVIDIALARCQQIFHNVRKLS